MNQLWETVIWLFQLHNEISMLHMLNVTFLDKIPTIRTFSTLSIYGVASNKNKISLLYFAPYGHNKSITLLKNLGIFWWLYLFSSPQFKRNGLKNNFPIIILAIEQPLTAVVTSTETQIGPLPMISQILESVLLQNNFNIIFSQKYFNI